MPDLRMSAAEGLLVVKVALLWGKRNRYQTGLAAALDALQQAEFHLSQSNLDTEGRYALGAVRMGKVNAKRRLGLC